MIFNTIDGNCIAVNLLDMYDMNKILNSANGLYI
jgi:hypothetical protein